MFLLNELVSHVLLYIQSCVILIEQVFYRKMVFIVIYIFQIAKKPRTPTSGPVITKLIFAKPINSKAVTGQTTQVSPPVIAGYISLQFVKLNTSLPFSFKKGCSTTLKCFSVYYYKSNWLMRYITPFKCVLQAKCLISQSVHCLVSLVFGVPLGVVTPQTLIIPANICIMFAVGPMLFLALPRE